MLPHRRRREIRRRRPKTATRFWRLHPREVAAEDAASLSRKSGRKTFGTILASSPPPWQRRRRWRWLQQRAAASGAAARAYVVDDAVDDEGCSDVAVPAAEDVDRTLDDAASDDAVVDDVVDIWQVR